MSIQIISRRRFRPYFDSPPADDSVSLSSLGGEGWGKEAIFSRLLPQFMERSPQNLHPMISAAARLIEPLLLSSSLKC